MRKYSYGSAFLLWIIFVLSGQTPAAFAQEPSDIPEELIPRFHEVNSGLYRGGMPGEEGLGCLQKMGVKTIVNLRDDKDERDIVEKLGMRYAHIPLTASKGIPDSSIREFFKIVSEPENRPVFVHCRRGADRTGTMIAFYRIAFEGWDRERAYREARDIGLSWWYFKLRKQIRNFDPKPFAEPIP